MGNPRSNDFPVEFRAPEFRMIGFLPMTPAVSETSNSSRLVPAILLACVTLLIYLVLPCVLEKIGSSEPAHLHELIPWVKPVTRELLNARQDQSDDFRTAAQFFSCCAGLFAAYILMLRLAKRDRSSRMQSLVFFSGAAFLAMNLLSPLLLSTDVFSYALYGRVVSFYGGDAYTELNPPGSSSDPFLLLVGQDYINSMYGPLWTLISAGFTRIGGVQIGLTVLLFRGLAAAAVIAGAGLILKILRRISPERATQGLVLFMWNPLVIIESGLSGHNDATMAALLLLGVWLHLKGRNTGTVVAFTLSAMVKFVTGPLALLYLFMVLRQISDWRARARFAFRSAICAGVVIVAVSFMANVKTGVPAARFAGSAKFYTNNFHELIFKGVRRWLGEDAEAVHVPIDFQSWWIAMAQTGELRAVPDAKGRSVAHLEKNRKLLVIAPKVNDWVRVFDPVSRQRGYVSNDLMEEIDNDSGGLDDDPLIAQLEASPTDWPTVQRANLLIRRVCWALFALFGLLAAWRTTNFDRFLAWSAAVMLATYFLIMTQFWPWYVIWALALGALKPALRPAKLAMLLSAGLLTLYVTLDYAFCEDDWLYVYRSIPAVVLPVVIFLICILITLIQKLYFFKSLGKKKEMMPRPAHTYF